MTEKTHKKGRQAAGGIALIIIGLIALGAQFIDTDWIGLLFLPVLGLIFLAWGAVTRESGLFIPGGILSGIGVGTLLITGPFQNAGGEMEGGIFMFAFAAGWVLIPLLSVIFTNERHWWALIPAAVFAFIGAGLVFGGALLTSLELIGRFWPVVLILIGFYILLRRGVAES